MLVTLSDCAVVVVGLYRQTAYSYLYNGSIHSVVYTANRQSSARLDSLNDIWIEIEILLPGSPTTGGCTPYFPSGGTTAARRVLRSMRSWWTVAGNVYETYTIVLSWLRYLCFQRQTAMQVVSVCQLRILHTMMSVSLMQRDAVAWHVPLRNPSSYAPNIPPN